MGQALTIQMNRSLALAPALQRSLRLLQMGALEFQQEVQNALDENPLLEDEPGSEPPLDPIALAGFVEHADHGAHQQDPADNAEAHGDGPDVEHVDRQQDDSAAGMVDWPGASREGGGDGGGRHLTATEAASAETTLREHLLSQVGSLPLPDREALLATVIVDSIDPTGYLQESLEDLVEVAQSALDDFGPSGGSRRVTLEDIRLALTWVQGLEPAGVGARSVSECLLLQLAALPAHTGSLDVARQIVADHLELLAGNDFLGLETRLGLDSETLSAATRLIRSLDPKPGLAFGNELVAYAVPEVIVRKVDGLWVATLHPVATPRIRINPGYAAILSRDGAGSLGGSLQDAQWLLRSITQRSETIERTAAAIVARQQAFFEHGDIGLKPMKLIDIANDIGVHESTVSRVVSHKYLQCPSGLVPLRRFFTSHVETAAGMACSATAVKAMIRQLVDGEQTGDPHSDHRLTRLLTQRGIRISRRTVTKYRDALGIEAADMRRQLAQPQAVASGEPPATGRSTIRRVSRRPPAGQAEAAGAGRPRQQAAR